MSTISVRGELSLDGSGWDKTMRKAEEEVLHLAGEALSFLKGAIAEAFVVGAVVELANKTIEFGAQIEDAARRLGVTNTAVQELRFAASQAGSSLETVENGLDKIAKGLKTIEEGGAAGAELQASFQRLGVTLDELKSKTPEELFRIIGERLEETGTNAQHTADVMTIFGRAGGQLIPVLEELGEKSKLLHEFHLNISDHELDRLRFVHNVIDGIGLALKRVASVEIGGLLDVLASLGGGGIAGALKDAANVKQNNQAASDKGTIAAMEKTLALQKEMKAASAAADAGLQLKPIGPAQATPEEANRFAAEGLRLAQDTAKTQEKNRFDRMSTEEKIADRQAKVESLKGSISLFAKAGDNGSTSVQDLKNQLVHAQGELNKLNADHLKEIFPKDGRANNGFKMQAGDSLTRTGNFLGQSSSTIVSIGERQLHVLTAIRDGIHGLKGSAGGNVAGGSATALGVPGV